MAAYTLLQLFEVVVASLILLIGVLKGWSPVALLGGGFLIGKAILNILWPEGGSRMFLIGKAILNILWPEGGSVYRRSLIGYGVAAVFVLTGAILAHFAS